MERIAKSERRLCAYKRFEQLGLVVTNLLAQFYAGFGDPVNGHDGGDLTPYINDEMRSPTGRPIARR